MGQQTIQVHAILTEPNLVTEAAVRQMLADASTVYASIGLTFELAALEPDYTHGLEQDGEKGPPPLEFELKRTARAIRYPGRLVIFFRAGHDHYSSAWGEYVVMSGADSNGFAHEVGHFLHLGHTHSDSLTDALYDMSKDHGYQNAKELAIQTIREAGGLHVFDGDAPAVSDTPPDPGPPLYQVSGYDVQGNAKNGTEHCGGTVTLDVDGVAYQFDPDRTNIMSYFFGCGAPLTISPDQAQIIKRALSSQNRRHLVDGVSPEPPTAVASTDGAIHVFARGDDLEVWHAVRQHQEWSGYTPDIGAGTLTSGVTAIIAPDGAIHVFGRGTDGNLWHTFGDGTTWSGWRDDVGQGVLTSAPTAVVSSDGAIHVFARGTDQNIWHTFWDGIAWSGWRDDLGAGMLTSGPTAVVMPDGHLHVFARGTDRNVWHTFWDGTAWSGWRDNAGTGTLTSAPTALLSPDGAIHLFARGDDRRLWHTFWNGETWRGWLADVGDKTFVSGPAAVVSATNVIHLFALSDDRNIWQSSWEHQQWSPWVPPISNATFQP